MAKKKKASYSGLLQLKETGESILFALILAFVFRGFLGQAFVIPTGSMAPTLYGEHIDHICSSCGYGYAVSLDQGQVRWVACPNCGWQEPPVPTTPRAAGDGIFTLSWPFALGGAFDPQRWDVIVFKAPFNMRYDEKGRPIERDGETNYIKRLIGLPGDVIAIVEGDIYTARAESLPETIRAKLLSGQAPPRLTPDEKAQLNDLLRIARKPAKAQEALWQIVFNADYVPTKGSRPGWTPVPGATGWQLDNHAFSFQGQGDGPAFLQLKGKDFLDDCRYNLVRQEQMGAGTGQFVVSDLLLRTAATWQGGQGRLFLQLSKGGRLYTVEIDPARGVGRTLHGSVAESADRKQIAQWDFRPWKRNAPVQVGFANVDHELQVWMDGRLIWKSPLPDGPDTAAWAREQPPEQRPPLVRVGAEGLQLQLRHLVVMRDVYYRDRNRNGSREWDVTIDIFRHPAAPITSAEQQLDQRPGWATRDNPVLLRDNEYFMLGDNSPASYDGRRWGQQGQHLAGREPAYRPGTVPADQLVGKAFFVYWPSWYSLYGMRVIPNIGEMRWVH